MDASLQSMGDMALMQAGSSHAASSAAALASHGARDMAQIDKTSSTFESMFATQMLQPMFEGVGVDPLFGGGHGEEVMRSFLLDEYGKVLGKSGMFGIAAAVKNEMIRAQSHATTGTGGPNAASQP